MALSPSDRNYLIVVSVVIILIILVGSGVIYILAQRQQNQVAEKATPIEPSTPTTASTPKTIATLSPTTLPITSPTTSPTFSPTASLSPSPSATVSPSASPIATKTVEVSMQANGFSPNSITINQNDTVCFVNKDDVAHWPASAEHPTHTVYPEFDPKKAVQPDDSYCFTFGRIGNWKYHDHPKPAVAGTVIVNAR
jgi:plastocyanin